MLQRDRARDLVAFIQHVAAIEKRIEQHLSDRSIDPETKALIESLYQEWCRVLAETGAIVRSPVFGRHAQGKAQQTINHPVDTSSGHKSLRG